jgi:hypothetical protein
VDLLNITADYKILKKARNSDLKSLEAGELEVKCASKFI